MERREQRVRKKWKSILEDVESTCRNIWEEHVRKFCKRLLGNVGKKVLRNMWKTC
jgi:hypothetical protein